MKRVVICITVAVLLFCGAFVPQNSVAQCSKQLKLYTSALQRFLIYGDTATAYKLVNQALALDSNYVAANHLLSRLESDPERAMYAAERAIASDSTNHHLLEQAAETALRTKRYDKGKEFLTRLVEHSQEPDHFRLLAMLHNLNKDHDKALAVVDSAEVRLGKNDFFSRMRQQLYLEKGDMQNALKCAIELVESAPYDPANHTALAEVYAAIGVDSLADVSFNNALNIEKKDPSLWYSYAGFLDSRKRYTDMLLAWYNIIELEQVPFVAKKQIVQSITSNRDFYRKHFLLVGQIISRLYQLYPQNIEAIDSYTAHLIAGNHIEEASVLLKQRIKDKEPSIEELSRIIEIENYLGRTDSVEVYVNKGIDLYPTNELFWNFKSWLQVQRKDNYGAIETLKEALKFAIESTSKSTLWGSIGDQYHELGKTKKSYSAYYKALNFNPQNAVVLNNFAYHLSVTGKNLKQALQMAQRATTLSPNNATYLDTLAWVYYKLGQYDEAKRVMQQAMSFDKNNSSELALHYGDILDALGSTFMAQTYWRKALERGAEASKIEQRIEAQQQRLNSKKSEEK